MANRENIKNRINNGIWRECLPPDFSISEITNIGSWNTMGSLAKKSHNLFKIINGLEAEPESLVQVHNYLDKLEYWVEKYSDDFTYPASKKGFESAIRKTLENEKLEDFATLYGVFHKEIFDFYVENKDSEELVKIQNADSMKMLKNIFTSAEKQKELKEVKPILEVNNDNIIIKEEAKIAEPISNTVVQNPVLKEKETIKMEPDSSVSEEEQKIEKQDLEKLSIKKNDSVDKEAEYFNKFYNDNIKSDFEPTLKSFLLKRHIESRIKDVYENLEGSDKSLNEWLKSTLLLSISKLEDEKVKFIVNHWPEWNTLQNDAKPLYGRVNNEQLLDEKAFWHSIKSINEVLKKDNDEETTKNLYQKVVPNIVSISSSNVSDKLNIGKNILRWATKNEMEFVNRLNLWNKMGGNITETTKEGESIVSWISSQKNEMWDKVIVNFAKEKNLNLNKFYPTHFKPKNSIHIARNSSMDGKSSPF